MNETAAPPPFADIESEHVIARTVRPAVRMRAYQTEMVRTPDGTLTGAWTNSREWLPSDRLMELMRDIAAELKEVDVVTLKWEREA